MAGALFDQLARGRNYVKLRGEWAYLYPAVDKIDFYLSPTRNTAANRFLGKALSGLKDWEQPDVINTDKPPI